MKVELLRERAAESGRMNTLRIWLRAFTKDMIKDMGIDDILISIKNVMEADHNSRVAGSPADVIIRKISAALESDPVDKALYVIALHTDSYNELLPTPVLGMLDEMFTCVKDCDPTDLQKCVRGTP